MITTIVENNKELHFVTQQYVTGLYVAVYEELGKMPVAQFVSSMPEQEYHKMLIKKQRRVSK